MRHLFCFEPGSQETQASLKLYIAKMTLNRLRLPGARITGLSHHTHLTADFLFCHIPFPSEKSPHTLKRLIKEKTL